MHVAAHLRRRSPTTATRSACARRTRPATRARPRPARSRSSPRDRRRGSSNGPEGLTSETSPNLRAAFAPQPAATFECKLDAGQFTACTSPYSAPGCSRTARTRSRPGRPTPRPATSGPRRRATSRSTGPRPRPRSPARSTPVHSGLLAFAVQARTGPATQRQPLKLECALDDGAYGSCATVLRADNLAAGDHVYRARATDAAGNVSDPAEFPFTVVNAAPVATLDVDADSGPAPHTLHAAITATDADNDRLTYTLDFGDGQTASGALPAGAIEHRYAAAGDYTARLRVTDGRDPVVAERAITVTTAQALAGADADHAALAHAQRAGRRPRHVHPGPRPRLQRHADRDHLGARGHAPRQRSERDRPRPSRRATRRRSLSRSRSARPAAPSPRSTAPSRSPRRSSSSSRSAPARRSARGHTAKALTFTLSVATP